MSKRISPKTWNKFEQLLFTYWPRFVLHETNITHEEFFQYCAGGFKDPEKWEKLYGIGFYTERKMLLESLRSFIAPAHADAVFDALAKAHKADFTARKDGRSLDRKRMKVNERRVIKDHLTIWLNRAKKYLETYDIAPLAPEYSIIKQLLENDFLKKPIVNSGLRRGRVGKPEKPWIKQAYRELSAAGITNIENRKELLQAVGLLPYPT